MAAPDAMMAAPRAANAGSLKIVLVPVSHPELGPIQIHETLFAIGRTEAPFDAYPTGMAADLSRRHARIFCEHGAVYFADLGSKNGSTVNGVAVKQAITTLKDGDLLGLGKSLSYRVLLEQGALAPPPARLARLILHPEGGAELQPIVVTGFPFLVSKADDTFARYKDSEPAQVNYLSRRHAHLFLKGGELHIEDLGSTNGTFVNGVRLDEHALALHEGDVLAFGGRHFVYRVALEWEAAARDPTLTRIGAVRPPAALDADRTTFVAAADSFLDIFCVDPAPAAADAPESAEVRETAPPARGKGGAAARRLRRWGIGALALVLLLVWGLYRLNAPEREVEDLLAASAYAEAAEAAGAALANDPDNGRLKTLGTEALLKAALPDWIAQIKAGRFERARQAVAAMRRHAGRNPDLAPLLDELDWIVTLEAFVAARGGAQAAVAGAADRARIEQLLRQWDERDEASQRAFETMSAHVPAFRDAYADVLSDVRRLALVRGQP